MRTSRSRKPPPNRTRVGSQALQACSISSRRSWFWSDQYDVKLQIAGLPYDAELQVVRGDPASGRFAVFHLNQSDGDRVVCVEAVNAAPEFMAGRQLIGRRTRVDPKRLADLSISMKDVQAA